MDITDLVIVWIRLGVIIAIFLIIYLITMFKK